MDSHEQDQAVAPPQVIGDSMAMRELVEKVEQIGSMSIIDFARVQFGVDIPMGSGLNISPFIAGSGTVFLTQKMAEETSWSNISNPKVNVFVNAGVMARFDLFGGNG